jgi:hypothetical protein
MLLAQRAVARRVYERNPAGHAVNNHVVEAPDARAEGKKHQKPVPEGDFLHKKPQKQYILEYINKVGCLFFRIKKINLKMQDAPPSAPLFRV